jgi:uncharacterized surface protein with fasciclin (FAS1) repeats
VVSRAPLPCRTTRRRDLQEILPLKRLFLKAAAVAAAGAVLQACGGGSGGGAGSDGPPDGDQTLRQVLDDSADHALFLRAIDKAGLGSALTAAGTGLTVFAPTDAAFGQLAGWIGAGSGADLVNALSAAQWTDILNFHLVPQRLSLQQLRDFAAADTGTTATRPATRYEFRGNPQRLIFTLESGALFIWDGIARTSITLATTDVPASNGVVHASNDVLLPRGVLTVGQMLRASVDAFSEFAASLTTELADTLDQAGPFTLFAPVNGRVGGALTSSVVRNHIIGSQELGGDDFPTAVALTTLASRQVTLRRGPGTSGNPSVLATVSYGAVTPANVTDVDFFGSNGVIHDVDRVMTLS